MMQEFSARTAARLGDYTLFKLLLPVFRAFLDINVRKEIEKDRLVILRAADAQRVGSAPQEADILRLLQQAREIDQKFLQQAAVFPVNIHIAVFDMDVNRPPCFPSTSISNTAISKSSVGVGLSACSNWPDVCSRNGK